MEDRIYRLFGSRVRALREQKSVTQGELARKVALSRTTITNIEQGRQRVVLHQIVGIANALDVEVSALIQPEETRKSAIRPDVAKVLETLRAENQQTA